MYYGTRGRLDGKIWKYIPHTGSVIKKPRSNVPLMRRVMSRLDRVGIRLIQLSGFGIHLRIPDSNGGVSGCGDNAPPIGSTRDRPHQVSVPWVSVPRVSVHMKTISD